MVQITFPAAKSTTRTPLHRTDVVDDTHKAIEARGKDFRAIHTFDPSNKVAVEIPEQQDTFIVPSPACMA
jgi:hypothetical protein